ncbi:MAG: CRTAC1 family protein [bacterium]|nr:CRTAC1 family protein [bacterium]
MTEAADRRGRSRPWLTLPAIALSIAGLASPIVAQEGDAPAKPAKRLSVPADVLASMLEERSDAQHETLDQFADETFYFFRFADKTAESGIRFRHRIVDDAGRDYKMVHYDHGNGVAVADIDADGLYDLFFTTQVGGNELWRNRGKGRFENVTEAAGVALENRISVTASFADVDNDGDADLFVTTVKMGNVLYLNDGKGKFTDVSKAAGVDYVGHSSGAVFFDYDNDGLLDLFVANVGVYTTEERGRAGYWVGVQQAFSGHLFDERTEKSILYRNLGAKGGTVRFADVSKETGLDDGSWSGDASAIDLDRDGFVDLYLLNMQGDDHFYRNVEGKRFEDASAETFPNTPWGTMGVEFLDFDNNGLFDLALSDMHSDMSEIIGPEREKLKSRMQWGEEHLQGGKDNVFGNAFYRNLGEVDGKLKLEEVSDAVGTENYWPWGLSAGDLNADGFEDLFITASMNYPFRYGVNSLLLNNQGEKFLDSEFILGAEPRKGNQVTREWFDLDCGGADKDHAHCEGQDGPVTVLGTLGTRGSVLFDLDRDGDLDIVTNEFNSLALVLISDLSEQREVQYLEVELVGTRSNRDGLGAVVRVVAGDLTLTQSHDGKSGYLSHSSLPLYFGLGEQKKIDRVEVDWPSGARQVVSEGVTPGKLLVIEEPAAAE